jgi:FixJ family two-component response regulator
MTAPAAAEVHQPLSGIVTNGIGLRMLAADPPNVDGAREADRRAIRDGNRRAEVIARSDRGGGVPLTSWRDVEMSASLARAADDGLRSAAMTDSRSIVFIVDDDISVRESLEPLIRVAGWQPEVFASAQEFLSRPRTAAPSCLVLDVNLPDLNGLDLQRQVAVDRVEMPIIFLTGYADVPMTVQAMKGGAVEFLTKPFDDEVLLSAIRNALERSRSTLDQAEEIQVLRDRHASLSRREQEVMALVVSGLLNKQVGFELGISEITVKAHRGQVMRKMEADSLADLVTMAGQLGLAPPQRRG